jgi:putative tryptophan/tyrosine transport system substrate-binding protein
MKRRAFITLLGGTAAWPLVARAQPGEKLRRIGVMIALVESDPEGQLRVASLRRGLQSFGWVEDRNIQIDYRWPGGNPERLQTSAAELVAIRPDVIVAGTTTALIAVQQATSIVPIVFVQVSDPLARGYVASLARPGSNVTGFALHEHAIAAKWFELLTEIAPRTARVGIIYDPANAAQNYLMDIEKASSPGITLSAFAAHSRSDVEQAIEQMGAEPNGALIVLSGSRTALHRDLIIISAVKHGLPLVYPYRYFTAAGGLMSYGPDVVDQYRLAAAYVDRILRGEKPGDLPVQLPTKYSLVINLKTAKALGLTVPDKLLALADEVIE